MNSDILFVSLMGAARGIFCLPLEHPFEYLKTRMQSSSENSNARTIARRTYSTSGFPGFYKGVQANVYKYTLKQGLRFPLIIWLPSIYGDSSKPSVNIATGVTISTLETFLICPLERIKICLMTATAKTTYRDFLGHELFAGLAPLYCRQVASWTSFLVGTYQIQNIGRYLTNKEQLNFWQTGIVGACVGVINTAVTMPFDYVKVQLQQANRSASNWREVLSETRKQSGRIVNTIYKGTSMRMIQYIIHGTINIYLINYFERMYKTRITGQ